jgi:hypothetical protein
MEEMKMHESTSDEVVAFETNLVYPGTLSREEATAILGFDPGPANAETKSIGYITRVDKENGIITISSKIP